LQKVKRKIRKETNNLVKSFDWVSKEPRSALGSFLVNNNNDECDFEMNNHITMGQNRKLKKKMKKLQKKIPENQQKIFREMQKYKEGLYRIH